MARLFLGLPLSAEDRAPVLVAQEAAKSQLGGWRVVPAENWHVTLHFLGEITAEKIPPLEKWLRALAIPKLPPLTWSHWLAFPEVAQASVVALAADLPTPWGKWTKELAQLLEPQGFKVEKRAFVPHLTLFRRKENSAVPLPSASLKIPYRPLHLCLYESQLTAKGSRYTARVQKALAYDAKAARLVK